MKYDFTLIDLILSDAPNVTVSPTPSLTVNVTDTAILTCLVFAVPLPNITWIKEEEMSTIEGDEEGLFINETDSGNFRTSVLYFTNVSKFDQSYYTCMASNGIQNVLNTPTDGSIALVVQGMLFITVSYFKLVFNYTWCQKISNYCKLYKSTCTALVIEECFFRYSKIFFPSFTSFAYFSLCAYSPSHCHTFDLLTSICCTRRNSHPVVQHHQC